MNKAERELQSARSASRKRDAHEKIQLGGLVVKAGLRSEDKAIILGLLAEAAETLGDTEARERFRKRGKAIFDNDRETGPASDRTMRPDVRVISGGEGQ